MSDKALIQGVGSVMVRDWPHLFWFTPFCLKGCQQLLLMPAGRGLLPSSPTQRCGRKYEVFLQHLGCWFGMCYLGEKPRGLLNCRSALGSSLLFPAAQENTQPTSGFLKCDGGRNVCAQAVAGRVGGIASEA